MKRIFDISLALIALIFLIFPMIAISLIIFFTSGAPVIFWSKRIGKNNELFLMPKFRTMTNRTPNIATHLLKDPESYLTRSGRFLRKYSLDEIPQILTILKGEMSFVGPRPALYNQDDLIKMRTKKNIHLLKPGITGWAQINGRDSISLTKKVELDEEYLLNISTYFDLKIMALTILRVIGASGVKH